MTITAAIVLFAVIWFITLLVALPIGVRTQAEEGDVTPGTPPSAPANPNMRRKLFWTTVVAVAVWAPLTAFILWGGVTIRDLDFWGRM